MNFAGTTILVTGAASGIGLATARHLADLGAGKLILMDRNGEALAGLSLRCETRLLVGDVADEALWADAELGPLDHAVLNAGVTGAGAIADLPFAEWRRVLSVNLDGLFLSLRASLHAIREGGSIVVTASASGLKATRNVAAYGASKAAAIQLTKVAALEAAERRVRVNAIAPGGVETAMWETQDWFRDLAGTHGREGAYRAIAEGGTPLGRFARPEEIAAQIAFLLSNEASGTMTGTVLVSDGGYLAG
ncbi:SDR family oxidoreductase [Sphingomonas rosea]|uniref:SDR family oxidoreductase n=1 Tax=Sphingomonas rosea TaxID=335605 RepID=A0ABP7UCN4_9SPHN